MSFTGIINNISKDGTSASILPDAGGDALPYSGAPIPRNINDGDGISYELDGRTIINIELITSVDIRGELVKSDLDPIRQLVVEINKRLGGTKKPPGGMDIRIKTR